MRGLLGAVVGLLAAAACLIVGALWYVRPEQALDLHYDRISFTDKAMEMAKSRRPVLTVTEDDLNDVLKQQLADHPDVGPQLEVTGAAFARKGERLEANVNVRWRDRVPIGAAVEYELRWKAPVLEAVPVACRVKDIRLQPEALSLPSYRIDLNAYLPKFLSIRSLRFDPDAIRVELALNPSYRLPLTR